MHRHVPRLHRRSRRGSGTAPLAPPRASPGRPARRCGPWPRRRASRERQAPVIARGRSAQPGVPDKRPLRRGADRGRWPASYAGPGRSRSGLQAGCHPRWLEVDGPAGRARAVRGVGSASRPDWKSGAFGRDPIGLHRGVPGTTRLPLPPGHGTSRRGDGQGSPGELAACVVVTDCASAGSGCDPRGRGQGHAPTRQIRRMPVSSIGGRRRRRRAPGGRAAWRRLRWRWPSWGVPRGVIPLLAAVRPGRDSRTGDGGADRRRDQLRVELRPGVATQPLDGGRGSSPLVRAVVGHRVVGVGDRHDPGTQGISDPRSPNG